MILNSLSGTVGDDQPISMECSPKAPTFGAPNSNYRAMVTPAKRGGRKKTKAANDKQNQTPAERPAAMTWAQRLKRVFDIDKVN
jgi:hypothetical protein